MVTPGHKMRRRDIVCGKCGKVCRFEFDMDIGKMVEYNIPTECKWPAKCPTELSHGIMDRQFGAKLIIPKM